MTTMVYVERRDGAICGLWTVCQWKGQEELPDDNPEVVAFLNRKPPKPTTEQVFAGLGVTRDDLKAFLAGK